MVKMTNCTKLPEEYTQIEGEISDMVRQEINKNSKEVKCITLSIKEAKNLSQLNNSFNELKLLRENIVSKSIQKLRDQAYKWPKLYRKILPFGRVSRLFTSFIEHEVDELLNTLSDLNKTLIDAVKTIAKTLGATGFSVTIGFPLNLSITFNYDVK